MTDTRHEALQSALEQADELFGDIDAWFADAAAELEDVAPRGEEDDLRDAVPDSHALQLVLARVEGLRARIVDWRRHAQGVLR